MGCLFCEIAEGNVNADIIYQNEKLIAFKDINPQAPTHILIIPHKHIATIDDADSSDQNLLGQMVLTAKKIAIEQELSEKGYRMVFNVNSGGGQEVYHIHLHLLGGRQMTWPPG